MTKVKDKQTEHHRISNHLSGGKGHPIVKYSDTLQSSVQKWLNWSRCRLGCGLGWAQGSTSLIVFARWRQCALGATWWIRLNHLSAVVMWPYVKLVYQLLRLRQINAIWIFRQTAKTALNWASYRLPVLFKWCSFPELLKDGPGVAKEKLWGWLVC